MPSLLRPDAVYRLSSDLGRAETAARVAMASFADDALSFSPRPWASPYGWCGAGLAVTGAVLGAVFLFGPV